MNKSYLINNLRGGVYSSEDIAEILGSRQTLKNYVDRGEIQRVMPGYYGVDAPLGQEQLMIAQKYYPDAVIGGQSALFYQNLSDFMPDEITLLVDNSTNPRSNDFFIFKRTSKCQLDFGIEKIKIQGLLIKCLSAERCLLESASKGINSEVFVKAVKKYFEQHDLSRVEDLLKLKGYFPEKAFIAVMSALQAIKESKNIY